MTESPMGYLPRSNRIPSGIAAFVCSAVLALTGCASTVNKGLGYEPEKMAVDDAKELVRRQSSLILDVSGLKYETTNGAPVVSRCGEVENGYRVSHSWKVFGPSREVLTQALERLHAELPKRGWKTYRFEQANSKARQMQLDVEDLKLHHTVSIEEDFVSRDQGAGKWEKAGRDGLFVYLNSPCYVDPAYKGDG
ncbi:hypothetical protein [Streptomyces sp. NPDC053079]|uniref:hypothetical protein n=1 Tax=Streptomyces sp. NPDC053079 TaxID=3365697 RepID=UPI0037D5789C